MAYRKVNQSINHSINQSIKPSSKRSVLTIVQPNCGPRSLKYMVAVVPTGRLCKISSSLSDFSSEEEEEKCEYANSASPEMEA